MRPADNINELIKKLQLKASADLDRRVHEDISRTPAEKESAATHPNIRRMIMKSPIVKLAVVAVTIIVCVIGLSLWRSTGSGIVLADVLARVEQAQAYRYKMDMAFTEHTNPEKPMIQKIEGTIIVSNEYGTKYEMQKKWEVDRDITPANIVKTTTELTYILPNRKLRVLIKPEQKKYERTELDDDRIATMKKEHDNPREMITQMLHCEYTKLGRSVIDGIEVEGFETTDPKWTMGTTKDYEDVRVKLWVDVETWLPVLWETDTTINEQMSLRTVFYDFQWEIPVVASDFEPVIPADYTPINKYELPRKFEEEALRGLRFFVEIFGHYPEDIDQNSLASDPYFLRNRENLTDAGLKLKEELESLMDHDQQWVQRAMEISKPIQSIGVFYKILVDNSNDPAYYGQTVGPEDTDAVLLRWKISDNEYRIIFGDLSVGNATAEELAKLEQS